MAVMRAKLIWVAVAVLPFVLAACGSGGSGY
jgi:predicted small secreted protein